MICKLVELSSANSASALMAHLLHMSQYVLSAVKHTLALL